MKNSGRNLNFLTRWKIQLESQDRKMHTVALIEMVEMFNNLSEENFDEISILLINSDICHFLSETMSYRDKTSISLINKIICHLSETEAFFKTDFFRVVKGYSRVLNSFPDTLCEHYQQDIFKCIGIVFKR